MLGLRFIIVTIILSWKRIMLNIPIYVYVIFAALVWLGLRYCRPRTVTISRLALLPCLMAYSGVRGYADLFPSAGTPDIAAAVAGGLAGALAGWLHANGWDLRIDRAARQITMPGDPMMLVIILSIFAFEFALRYGAAVKAAWFLSGYAAPATAAVWSLFVLMSAGRNLNLAHRYLQTPAREGSAA